MPEWVIWVAAIWLFFALTGRGGCRRGRIGPGRWPGMVSPGARPRMHRWPERRPADRAAQRLRAPRRPPETAEERLRRQFVEGRLSMEEYEAALWRELGPRAP